MTRVSTIHPFPAGILDQAKAAATSAVNTAGNLASQAATTTSNLATQAANSQTAADMTEGAKNLSAQAQAAMGGLAQQAGGLAGQAHQQAHTLAPGVIPAPAEGVDRSSDLEPEKAGDRAKFEKLFDNRATATDLKSKGILKGQWIMPIDWGRRLILTSLQGTLEILWPESEQSWKSPCSKYDIQRCHCPDCVFADTPGF